MNKKFIARLMAALLVFGGWGFITAEFKIFPYQVYWQAKLGYKQIRTSLGLDLPWHYHRTEKTARSVVFDAAALQSGHTLVSGIGERNTPEARIVDSNGATLHLWDLDWFKIWPDADHMRSADLPKARPGTHTHGMLLLDNGDLVFNFEMLGLVRVDFCGNVLWKVPRATHHSLFQDEDGNFWVPEQTHRSKKLEGLPSYDPGFKDQGILKVSASGEVLAEWRLFDIFRQNNLQSLLYTTNRKNWNTIVSGDTLHLNDVEVFPRHLPQGAFSAGDVMLSIRNINAIMVFNSEFDSLKQMFIGPFVRQHDPDFVDGDSITVFDNYTHTLTEDNPRSRLISLTAGERAARVLFEGSVGQPFFTNVMGKHQQLTNGNFLLNEARRGRAVEVDSSGNIVWEYNNLIGDGLAGLVSEAQRLGPQIDAEYIRQRKIECKSE